MSLTIGGAGMICTGSRRLSFSGAKLVLFVGADLLVILRDDYADIPYPGHWDLPGGGRDGSESPQNCVLRETREEVGLEISPSQLVWTRKYKRPHGVVWFFAAHLPAEICGQVRLGSEGQSLQLMPPDAFCAHPLAVPHLAQQTRNYMAHPQYLANITV